MQLPAPLLQSMKKKAMFTIRCPLNIAATAPNCTLSAAGSLSLAPRVFALSARRPLKLNALLSPIPVRPGLVAAAHFGDFRMRGCKRRSNQIARHRRRATSLKDVR